MTTTLTQVATGTSATIRVVTSYDSDIVVGNLVHVIIGSGVPDFTIKPAQPRSGTFEFLCANETEAISLRNLLRTPGPFVLADTSTAVANTTFMVTGRIGLRVDPETQRVCLVSVEYTAVTA